MGWKKERHKGNSIGEEDAVDQGSNTEKKQQRQQRQQHKHMQGADNSASKRKNRRPQSQPQADLPSQPMTEPHSISNSYLRLLDTIFDDTEASSAGLWGDIGIDDGDHTDQDEDDSDIDTIDNEIFDFSETSFNNFENAILQSLKSSFVSDYNSSDKKEHGQHKRESASKSKAKKKHLRKQTKYKVGRQQILDDTSSLNSILTENAWDRIEHTLKELTVSLQRSDLPLSKKVVDSSKLDDDLSVVLSLISCGTSTTNDNRSDALQTSSATKSCEKATIATLRNNDGSLNESGINAILQNSDGETDDDGELDAMIEEFLCLKIAALSSRIQQKRAEMKITTLSDGCAANSNTNTNSPLQLESVHRPTPPSIAQALTNNNSSNDASKITKGLVQSKDYGLATNAWINDDSLIALPLELYKNHLDKPNSCDDSISNLSHSSTLGAWENQEVVLEDAHKSKSKSKDSRLLKKIRLHRSILVQNQSAHLIAKDSHKVNTQWNIAAKVGASSRESSLPCSIDSPKCVTEHENVSWGGPLTEPFLTKAARDEQKVADSSLSVSRSGAKADIDLALPREPVREETLKSSSFRQRNVGSRKSLLLSHFHDRYHA